MRVHACRLECSFLPRICAKCLRGTVGAPLVCDHVGVWTDPVWTRRTVKRLVLVGMVVATFMLLEGCGKSGVPSPAETPSTVTTRVPVPVAITTSERVDSLVSLGPLKGTPPTSAEFDKVWTMLLDNPETSRFLDGTDRVRVGDLSIKDASHQSQVSVTSVYVVDGQASVCERSGPYADPSSQTTASRQIRCTGTFYVAVSTGEIVRLQFQAAG
jgi:hypothetical protein